MTKKEIKHRQYSKCREFVVDKIKDIDKEKLSDKFELLKEKVGFIEATIVMNNWLKTHDSIYPILIASAVCDAADKYLKRLGLFN